MKEKLIKREYFESLIILTQQDFERFVTKIGAIQLIGILIIGIVATAGIYWLNEAWSAPLLLMGVAAMLLYEKITIPEIAIAKVRDEPAFYLVWEEGKMQIAPNDYEKYRKGEDVTEGAKVNTQLKII